MHSDEKNVKFLVKREISRVLVCLGTYQMKEYP